MSIALTAAAHVDVRATCASCGREARLECEGLPGFWGYPTFNEYFCPHCRARNYVRSSGAIVAATAWTDEIRRQ
jgi:hypothetical protein